MNALLLRYRQAHRRSQKQGCCPSVEAGGSRLVCYWCASPVVGVWNTLRRFSASPLEIVPLST